MMLPQTRTAVLMLLAATACEATGPDKPGAGEGTASVDVNPGAITFEATPEEGLQTRTVSIRNTGDGPLTARSISLVMNTGEVSIVEGVEPGGTLSVAPRSQAWFTVAWSPESGPASGVLQFATTDPNKPVVELDVTAEPLSSTPTTDPEEVVDGEKVDVYLLLDVAYNYSCYHPELDRFIDQVIDGLYDHFGDVAVGFGVYDDYRQGSWATVGGPYEMRHAVSTNHDSVKEAASRLRMEYGGSDEGSAYEAIFQAAWGAGYDQTCNGTFDATTDIRPWTPMPEDAFSGAEWGLEDEFPTDGSRRGVGWRDGATHIIIYSVDNIIRDTAVGSELPDSTCSPPATVDTVARALDATDVRLLGINVYEWQASDRRPQQQLEALAEATHSHIDADGDGEIDDPAVLAEGWNWPPMDDVISAVEDLIRTRG